jgi:hypothetical protein
MKNHFLILLKGGHMKVLRYSLLIFLLVIIIFAQQSSKGNTAKEIHLLNQRLIIEIDEEIDLDIQGNFQFDKNELVWMTSNDQIANVKNGKLKGISQGQVTVTVTTRTGVKTSLGFEVIDSRITLDLSLLKRLKFLEESKSNTNKHLFYWYNDQRYSSFQGNDFIDMPYYFSGNKVPKSQYESDSVYIKDNQWLIFSNVKSDGYIAVADLPRIFELPPKDAFIEVWGTLTGKTFYSTYTNILSVGKPPIIKVKILKIDGKIVYEDYDYFEDKAMFEKDNLYEEAIGNMSYLNIEKSMIMLKTLGDYKDSKKIYNDNIDLLQQKLEASIKTVSNPLSRTFDLEKTEALLSWIREFGDEYSIKNNERYLDLIVLLASLKRQFENNFDLWYSKDLHDDSAQKIAKDFYVLKNEMNHVAQEIIGMKLHSYQDIEKMMDSSMFNVLVIDKIYTIEPNDEVRIWNVKNYTIEKYLLVVPWEMEFLSNYKDHFANLYNYEIRGDLYTFTKKKDERAKFISRVFI